MSPSTLALTPEQQREITEEFARAAGADSATLEALQALSPEDVMAAQEKPAYRVSPTVGPGWRLMLMQAAMKFKYMPEFDPAPHPSPAGLFAYPEASGPFHFPAVVLDGEYLIEQPLDALLHGAAADLEVLIGSNRDEDGFIPISPEFPNFPRPGCYGARCQGGHEGVVARMAWELAGMPGALGDSPEELRGRIARVAESYEKERASDAFGLGPAGNAVAGDVDQWLLDTMSSDMAFIAYTHLAAERLAQPGRCKRVFRYQFNGYGGIGNAFHGA